MEITFLGTAAMVPTKERNATATLLTHLNENILIDCGEGTQRQLKIANISPTKITKIFISHWHGDHVLGIPGLLYTIFSNMENKEIEIFGPKGTKFQMDLILKTFHHSIKPKIKIKEILKEGKFQETKNLEFYAKRLHHSVPCLGYKIKEKDKIKINTEYTKKFGLTKDPILKKLQEGKSITYKGKRITPKQGTFTKPGKSITIISDTAYNKDISKFALNSDLLITEATLSSELQHKAKEFKHLTTKESAKIAKDAKAKKLYMTHFSQRHKETTKLVKEAKKVFSKTHAAKDFDKVII